MRRLAIIMTVALLGMMLSSCGSGKRLTYWQDMEPGVDYPVTEDTGAPICKDDRIGIVITCSNPALAAPFNAKSGASVVNPTTGEITLNANENTSGYVVDRNGEINFPILGRIYVEGLTLDQLKKGLEDELRNRSYMKDPIVTAEFLNFQVTIIGETNTSNLAVPGGKMNLVQAIANSGDMTSAAIRKDVWVIRTENGSRKVYSVDFTKKDCFDSPAFYLRQNDIIYIKPNKNKNDVNGEAVQSAASLILSAITASATVFYWISLVFNK